MFVKFYNIFNYSTIAIVVVFLILILTETVSKEFYEVLLYITIGILVARIGLRIYLQSYLKKSKGE
jgi:uncharacterized membrane protein